VAEKGLAAQQKSKVATRNPLSTVALVALVEHEWNLRSYVPKPEWIAQFFNTTVEEVTSCLNAPETQRRLSARGIPVDSQNFLTAEQIAAANLMLDYTDTRSQSAKLKSAGINTQTWNGWLADPIFNRYLRSRAESLLDQVGVAEAHTALLKQTARGNVQAIKLLYEVTGRHRDSTSLNVEFFINRVVEIIQTHVKDPETLQGIAKDFQQLFQEIK
jgi:hypothetical protein